MITIEFKLLAAFACLLMLSTGCNPVKDNNEQHPNLLPGAKLYDVTQPASWGGDPSLAATPDDPSDDDAVAINAALQAAANYIDSIQVGIEVDWPNYGKSVYQQLVYIPEGTYHLESTVIVPPTNAYPTSRWGRKERFIWLHGAGENETTLELKSAGEIGVFGSDSLPRPIVQVVQYDPETYQGNDNFQLFVTDFSIYSPADQPHAIGLSYGVSNIGAARNLTIKAAGEGGRVGFAFVQRNTGPGIVENVTVEGFDKGVEIIDPWGEVFTFKDITVRNQNAGGIGLSVADKQIGLENFTSEQDQPDVTPILLHDDNYFNTEHGGAPHLTLINAGLSSSVKSEVPAVMIEKGHIYLRDIKVEGYGKDFILDHGQSRAMGQEYVSVHGKTSQQQDNVIFTMGNAPEESLMLPVKASPVMPAEAFAKLQEADYTILSQPDLNGNTNISTSWVIVDPSQSEDDTELLQAALNSGARFVGILNTEPLRISESIVINGCDSKNLELIFGYMSEIHVDESFSLNNDLSTEEKVAFRIETGNSENLIFKGFFFTADGGDQADFLLFQNNSSQNLVLEDLRCTHAPLVYRNDESAQGSNVFFNNIEFVYFGPSTDVMLQFDHQNVWGRQFDIEWLGHTDIAHQPLVVNNGGNLWLLSQKYGEHAGVFVQTENGGKTELLSAYYNQSRTAEIPPEPTTNFVVKDSGSRFSMTGQERIRSRFDEQGNATRDLPHGNQFGIVIHEGDSTVIEGTALPTYLKFEGLDPFQDTSYENYNRKNHFRVAGLLRVDVE